MREKLLLLRLLILAAAVLKRQQKRRNRATWVKLWLLRRPSLGVTTTLLNEFRFEEQFEYKRFLRMSPAVFDELLGIVGQSIQKQDTLMRAALTPNIKLAATIRYLTTGANYTELQHIFRIHKSTFGRIVPEVCDAIYKNKRSVFENLCMRLMLHPKGKLFSPLFNKFLRKFYFLALTIFTHCLHFLSLWLSENTCCVSLLWTLNSDVKPLETIDTSNHNRKTYIGLNEKDEPVRLFKKTYGWNLAGQNAWFFENTRCVFTYELSVRINPSV